MSFYNLNRANAKNDPSHFLDLTASCNDGDIRVVGGDSETYGRVELCLLGQWGSVQDEDWSVSDATVVCKQLGLDTGI